MVQIYIVELLEKETDPWLGNGDCEVWVGDRNSCNEERAKACGINCVISLLSTRAMTKAPAQWIKYEYDIEHYHFECTYMYYRATVLFLSLTHYFLSFSLNGTVSYR